MYENQNIENPFKLEIQFGKLECGTTFKSWTGITWVKSSENCAVPPDCDIEYVFGQDEVVFV